MLVLICKTLTTKLRKTTLSYSNNTFNIHIGLKCDLATLGKTSAKSEVLVFEWGKQNKKEETRRNVKTEMIVL